MSSPYDSSFDQREQIRDAVDIVDLVERYVPLRRQGANFVGRCPWHDDSRPSLQVNAQRQTFKCWVCNIGGDVFSFIMKMENVDFKESMRILADIAGIELVQRRRPRAPRVASSTNVDAQPTEASSVEIDKRSLYVAMDWLAKKYRETLLHSEEAQGARDYLRERGISDESSEKYRIGYSPLERDSVLNWIRFDRRRTLALETAGVLAFREEYDERGATLPRPVFEQTERLSSAEARRYFDRFRGRLVFPICDVQDRVVAFGGRLLPNTTLKSPAKYVNSPETPIFTKSKMVYGLDLARNAIRQTKKVLITEGYTDCIVASQFGFENVVAVLGTALGAEHVRILKRLADKMILLLDGDEPGQKRAAEVLRFFVEQGVDMSVLTLPNDEDPCEFLLENGADAFQKLLDRSTVDALDHAFNNATKGVDLDSDVVESTKALDALLDVVALFPAETRASNDPGRLRVLKTIQRLAMRFRVSEEEIRRRLDDKRSLERRRAVKDEQRELRRETRENDALEYDAFSDSVETFRKTTVYPAPNSPDETDDELRERFEPFDRAAFSDSFLRPTALEMEYLQIILVAPALFPRLVAKISNEDLRSPIARQLDLVARDYLEQGLEPTFDRVMLRYEDDEMKRFLIDLDADASNKGLAELLASPQKRDALLSDVFDSFERARLEQEEPKTMSALLEPEQSPDEKMKALLQIRASLQKRRQTRNPNSLVDDDDK